MSFYSTSLLEYGEKSVSKEEKHDTTGSLNYIRRCNEMGVVPVTYFLRHHDAPEFVMKYHGLGPKGTEALSIPLEVSALLLFYSGTRPSNLTNLSEVCWIGRSWQSQ